MRTLAEVQQAARTAQVLIRVLVDIGGMDGPPEKNSAVKDATKWFEEMKTTKTSTSAIECGRLRLEQDVDETGKGTGWFELYVNVC